MHLEGGIEMSPLLDDLGDARLGLGTMRLCGDGCWGWPADVPRSERVLRDAADAGIRLIDTADCYGPDVAEELVASVLYPYDDVIVATKAGVRHPAIGQWIPDAHPDRLRRCCDASLTRLRVEQIDLLQLHAVDPTVPLLESVGALVELRDMGKIKRIGLSNVSVDELDAALTITPVESVQNRYHLLDRSSEDVLRRCEELEIAFLAWRPLAMVGDDLRAAVEDIVPGADPAAVALAWLLQRSPVMCPVPGTSSPTNLRSILDSRELELSPDQITRLDDLVTE
jgi:aryl-alcohol dehydrogenase-like predicted oxidoreductase